MDNKKVNVNDKCDPQGEISRDRVFSSRRREPLFAYCAALFNLFYELFITVDEDSCSAL